MTDKEKEMEAIRRLSLTKMEEHYARRIEKLIDDMKLEDAEALCQEMTFEGDEGEDCDIFLDDLTCLLYTSQSPRDRTRSRMPSSA